MLVILFNLFLAGSATYAFVRGGAPEKVVAAAFVAAATATYLARPEWWTSFENAEVHILVIDVMLLTVLVAVALWANRFWPMWIAAFQLFVLLVHVTKLYQQDILPIVYFAVIQRMAYPMLLLLLGGTIQHFRRLRLYGSDPDWSVGRP